MVPFSNVRYGPGLGYSAFTTIHDGAGIGIVCQTYGDWVNGRDGSTNIWDQFNGGQIQYSPKYISDGFVYTGSDGLVAPLC
jgi:uncharacterized protein YraI